MQQDLLTVRVARKRHEALDICSFEFTSEDGGALPSFSAGSHIDVHLPNGGVRQYSLCNSPTERSRYLIGVLRDPQSRGGSVAMHEQVHEGDRVRISVPRNHFELERSPTGAILFAGGIGITPILCMAERLSAAGESFEMHYSTRSRDRTAFLARIKGSSFASSVNFHFGDADPLQRLDLREVLAAPHGGRHVYVCGPRGYIDAVLEAAKAEGWPEAQVHREFFAGQVDAAADSDAFQVKIASTGQCIDVPQKVSVIEALAAAGIEVPTSCEQGVCGTCITRVLDGIPDHRDSYLMPHEQALNDQFTPCCSRSKTPILVLDL